MLGFFYPKANKACQIEGVYTDLKVYSRYSLGSALKKIYVENGGGTQKPIKHPNKQVITFRSRGRETTTKAGRKQGKKTRTKTTIKDAAGRNEWVLQFDDFR